MSARHHSRRGALLVGGLALALFGLGARFAWLALTPGALPTGEAGALLADELRATAALSAGLGLALFGQAGMQLFARGTYARLGAASGGIVAAAGLLSSRFAFAGLTWLGVAMFVVALAGGWLLAWRDLRHAARRKRH